MKDKGVYLGKGTEKREHGQDRLNISQTKAQTKGSGKVETRAVKGLGWRPGLAEKGIGWYLNRTREGAWSGR